MASLTSPLVSQLFSKSAAEKAFRPWWITLEDYFVYGLVLLGIIVTPNAIVNQSPLYCNFCLDSAECPRVDNQTKYTVDPKYDANWVRQYCTATSVDIFLVYFPYFLLIMASVILLIEWGFAKILGTGIKLDTFYDLIVGEVLNDDDDDDTDDDKTDAGDDFETMSSLGNSKKVVQVSLTFAKSSRYFYTYLLRNAAKLTVAVLLFTWLVITGFPSIVRNKFIYCDVHTFTYECAGHPQQFYGYILMIALALLFAFMLVSAMNLCWLMLPNLRLLNNIMRKYKADQMEKINNEGKSTEEALGQLADIYYKNRDMGILLDLLAATTGVPNSLGILSLFDSKFRSSFEVRNLNVRVVGRASGESPVVEVEFDDAPVIVETFGRVPQLECIYLVEIVPSLQQGSVRVFKFTEKKGNTTTWLSVVTTASVQHKKTKFVGVDPAKDYHVKVCTVISGTTIAQKVMKAEVTALLEYPGIRNSNTGPLSDIGNSVIGTTE